MIKIEKVDIVGFESAIRGLRNPKNSWSESDSGMQVMNQEDVSFGYKPNYEYVIGEKDLHLMKTLAYAGTDHGKFLRMITVYVDVTAPLYWWKEEDTYKVGTVANSCSTMHKIHSKEFTMDDFSTEHLNESNKTLLGIIINALNFDRDKFNDKHIKEDWWQLIQMLPSSFNQKRTLMLNYAVLRNMYHSRKNHKLDEWKDFCKWIETLPHSELITGKKSLNSGVDKNE